MLRPFDIKAYTVCEDLTEALIYFTVVFSPWAFGATQPWAIWTMNIAGYALGLLLLIKLALRWSKGYRPARWATGDSHGPGLSSATLMTASLAVVTLLILAYCLISAVNARATYHPLQISFEYHSIIDWLPHSFDSGRSWLAFWNYLAMACAFWALCDWLLGKTGGEERAEHLKVLRQPGAAFPARLRRLLWVLCTSGGLLAVEAIIQRTVGTGKLLFLVQARVNPEAEAQFGPFAYRSNAAQYFNLLWPVCLGFWWTLNKGRTRRGGAHHLLLLSGASMAAGTIISTSRGGALVCLGIVVIGGAFLLITQLLLVGTREEKKESRNATLAALGLFFSAALVLGFALGWTGLGPRMAELGLGYDNREAMYAMAHPMAEDYPLFGTGPGSFDRLFQFYRPSIYEYWPAQLHNDWMETLITFGWVGTCLIVLALGIVLLRWFAPGGIHGGRRFVTLVWLALSGCLVHARWDFPFQIYSLVFLFLVLCAILFVMTRTPLVRRA